AVGHDDLDHVIVGMNVGFHRSVLLSRNVGLRQSRPTAKLDAAADEGYGLPERLACLYIRHRPRTRPAAGKLTAVGTETVWRLKPGPPRRKGGARCVRWCGLRPIWHATGARLPPPC